MRYSLGVDIGGMSVKYSFVGEDGTFFGKHVYHFPKGDQESQITDLALELKKAIAEQDLFKAKDLVGIGVGCPGAINSVTGDVDYSPNLHWLKAPLRKIISEVTGQRVETGNDANVATLGEAKFGAGQGYDTVIMITIGTGIGGGLYLNKELYVGKEGKGAELGHTIIVHGGEKCNCGLEGCLEAYASASALIRQTKAAMIDHHESLMWLEASTLEGVDGKTAFEAAKKGDTLAQEVVQTYIGYLGDGIINFCNIFRPDAILFSGGVSNQKEALLNPLKAYLKDRNYGYVATPEPDLKIASLGDKTGIYGAAALLFD